MAPVPRESRRASALALAEELLGDIELSRISPNDVVRKASRLARLLDDTDAAAWLHYEVAGYEHSGPNMLTTEAFLAARRSNRTFIDDDGKEKARSSTVGELEKTIESCVAQIQAAADRPVSIQSANPNQYVAAPSSNTQERALTRNYAGQLQGTLDKVMGAIHAYVAAQYEELRFGASVEGAFEVVRGEVDAAIGELVPDALPKLSAAFENATSPNPEDWASAAATCRRLIKAAADALRPPGLPLGGHEMTDDHYVNRLVNWIEEHAASKTLAALVASDLDHLGRRLDAVLEAGHKGAHTEVDRLDASRFVVGTYILLGDILRLRDQGPRPDLAGAGVAAEDTRAGQSGPAAILDDGR